MKFVSPLLKRVVYPGLSRTGYLRRHAKAGPMIVTYHGVLPVGYKIIDPYVDGNLVSATSFRQQLKFLLGCSVVPTCADQAYNGRISTNASDLDFGGTLKG